MGSTDGMTIADSTRVREMVERAAFEAQGGAMREGNGGADLTIRLRGGGTARVLASISLRVEE